MILLRHDLGILAEGVREGRRTFTNIMKYVMMGTSSNFGNMFSMAGAALILPFLPMLPVQILLNNLLYDLSEIPIPMDRVDPEMVAAPRHWDMRFVRDFMLVLGPVSSLFDFLTFGLLLWVFHAGAALFQTGWFIESMATQVLVIFIIRTRGNPFRSRPHPLLAVTSLLVVAVAVALPFTALGRWFGFVPVPPLLLAVLIPMTLGYLAAVQVVKLWFYRMHPLSSLARISHREEGCGRIGSGKEGFGLVTWRGAGRGRESGRAEPSASIRAGVVTLVGSASSREAEMGEGVLGLARECRRHGELDAATADADQGADLEQPQAYRAAGGVGELGVLETDAAQGAE